MFLDYGLLASERDVARLLGANITMLQSYADRFSRAVALLDYIDENSKAFESGSPKHEQFINWSFIAVESGIITTYNAFEALRQIAELYPESETIRQTMDEPTFLKARETFEANFPAMDKSVRTGVVHGAPAHASLKQHKKHMPDGGTSVLNMLSGRTVQSTLHGGIPTFTVDRDKSEALSEVVNLTMKAFEPSSEFTMRFNSVDQYDGQNPIVIPG